MSIDVTWPRKAPASEAEKLLREIFEYLGIDTKNAENATLISMVEKYKEK